MAKRVKATKGPKKDAAPKGPVWKIIDVFNHKGITYGPGEPLPKSITEDEIVALEANGKVMRLGSTRPADVTVGTTPPRTPQEYLAGTDLQVLRRLRVFHAESETIRAVAHAARTGGRGETLCEALALATMEPVK